MEYYSSESSSPEKPKQKKSYLAYEVSDNTSDEEEMEFGKKLSVHSNKHPTSLALNPTIPMKKISSIPQHTLTTEKVKDKNPIFIGYKIKQEIPLENQSPELKPDQIMNSETLPPKVVIKEEEKSLKEKEQQV
jgi:hypothetical protein